MNKKAVIGLGLVSLVASLAVTGCDPRPGDEAAAPKASGTRAAAAAARALSDADFDQAVATGVALVDFWAPWCGPCRAQGPIVEKVAEQVGTTALVAKVNVDENRSTAERFGVSGIPTLIVFKDGKPVQKFVGVQSQETLAKAIAAAAKP